MNANASAIGSDPYFWPNSTALQNKAGYRDPKLLSAFEYGMTSVRARFLPPQPLTPAGYKNTHRYLFQDVYDWAGHARTVDLKNTTTPFTPARFIELDLNALFAKLHAANNLRNLPLADFAAKAAAHMNAVNRIHVHREGNGRTMLCHLAQLCERAGHPIDMQKMDRADWLMAANHGMSGAQNPDSPMRMIIQAAQSPKALTPGPTPIGARVGAIKDTLAEIYSDPVKADDELETLLADHGFEGTARLLIASPGRLGTLRGTRHSADHHVGLTAVRTGVIPATLREIGIIIAKRHQDCAAAQQAQPATPSHPTTSPPLSSGTPPYSGAAREARHLPSTPTSPAISPTDSLPSRPPSATLPPKVALASAVAPMSTTSTMQTQSPPLNTGTPLGALLADVRPYITFATPGSRYATLANPRPVESVVQRVQHPRTPKQLALIDGVKRGDISKTIANALMAVADPNASAARRSSAAMDASTLLDSLAERAIAGAQHESQVEVYGKQVERTADALKASDGRVEEALQKIYKDPRAAKTQLYRLRTSASCTGPGQLATAIRESPARLCADKSGLLSDGIRGGLFSPSERHLALDAVPVLAAAVEERGKLSDRLLFEKKTFDAINQRPAQIPALAASLGAKAELAAIQKAFGGDDPLSAHILQDFAHVTAKKATMAEIRSAPNVPTLYRAIMEDQAVRRDNLAQLQRSRGSQNAVANYLSARFQMKQNTETAATLSAKGHHRTAAEAVNWAELAQNEAVIAADTIMSDSNQLSLAAQQGIVADIDAFRLANAGTTSQALAHQHSAAPALPKM